MTTKKKNQTPATTSVTGCAGQRSRQPDASRPQGAPGRATNKNLPNPGTTLKDRKKPMAYRENHGGTSTWKRGGGGDTRSATNMNQSEQFKLSLRLRLEKISNDTYSFKPSTSKVLQAVCREPNVLNSFETTGGTLTLKKGTRIFHPISFVKALFGNADELFKLPMKPGKVFALTLPETMMLMMRNKWYADKRSDRVDRGTSTDYTGFVLEFELDADLTLIAHSYDNPCAIREKNAIKICEPSKNDMQVDIANQLIHGMIQICINDQRFLETYMTLKNVHLYDVWHVDGTSKYLQELKDLENYLTYSQVFREANESDRRHLEEKFGYFFKKPDGTYKFEPDMTIDQWLSKNHTKIYFWQFVTRALSESVVRNMQEAHTNKQRKLIQRIFS